MLYLYRLSWFVIILLSGGWSFAVAEHGPVPFRATYLNSLLTTNDQFGPTYKITGTSVGRDRSAITGSEVFYSDSTVAVGSFTITDSDGNEIRGEFFAMQYPPEFHERVGTAKYAGLFEFLDGRGKYANIEDHGTITGESVFFNDASGTTTNASSIISFVGSVPVPPLSDSKQGDSQRAGEQLIPPFSIGTPTPFSLNYTNQITFVSFHDDAGFDFSVAGVPTERNETKLSMTQFLNIQLRPNTMDGHFVITDSQGDTLSGEYRGFQEPIEIVEGVSSYSEKFAGVYKCSDGTGKFSGVSEVGFLTGQSTFLFAPFRAVGTISFESTLPKQLLWNRKQTR
jgi:hypothetical protein